MRTMTPSRARGARATAARVPAGVLARRVQAQLRAIRAREAATRPAHAVRAARGTARGA
jgi:hypothetical protein